MPPDRSPDYSFFFQILRVLEEIDAPYMIIGAFAAALYGSTRVTYDIDITVDLREEHIQRLARAFPSPRYYADPIQMRDSIRMGIMFNIIDSSRGEKADSCPWRWPPRIAAPLSAACASASKCPVRNLLKCGWLGPRRHRGQADRVGRGSLAQA